MSELEAHYREQIATLHKRYDVLRGVIELMGDRQARHEEAMAQMRAQLAELAPKPPCSLCAPGEGCSLPSCGRAAPPPAP